MVKLHLESLDGIKRGALNDLGESQTIVDHIRPIELTFEYCKKNIMMRFFNLF